MFKTNRKFYLLDKSNVIFFIILIFLFIGIFQFQSFKEFIAKYENVLIDFRFKFSKSSIQSEDIIIVDIDASSINKLSLWPWPRSYWGTAIENLNKYGASIIGIDVLFDTNSLNNEEDASFSKTLSQHKNIVLASRKYIEKNKHYELELWSKPIKLFSEYSSFGFVNFPFDSDGIIRQSYTQLSSNQTPLPVSFDSLIVSIFKNTYPKIIHPSHIESFDTYYINFSLSKGFQHIPFFLIFEDRPPHPDIFKDKIVLIGASDPSLNDLYFTPQGILPGVDIHAYNILNLLKEDYITKTPSYINYILLFVLSFLIVTIVINFSGLFGFLITSGIILAYSVFSIVLFNYTFILIPWAIVLILVLLSFTLSMIFKLIFEEKEKTYIRNIFSQYVSPEIVNKLIQSPKALSLGGEKKEISIFFSDIRSFTSISEKHPPEFIVSQLNEYLDAMTLCIFKWKGTLDKYVGDEIMAIWGAPLDQSNHAKLAVQCAWEQLSILKELQAKWKEEGNPIFDIGIGINTGNVIVGNIGSSKHKDFTVIGDSVNYAARLESTTRQFSDDKHICRFIISESTYQQVTDICDVKSLGSVSVKGKENVGTIYEVINVKLDAQP
ncbi:hypothetical protein CL647_02710 [bacterium]|nr:hypothetical protein [Actinomycetota bacterium]MBE33021.1 hypothetical protein [bacterium]|tara:strand:+ start:4039 stop:5859 length:1821 start_codon:yes stop_codon:yes gene_type:complete